MDLNEKLKDEFISFISKKDKTENDVQSFLEEHTELIPLPFLENHGLHFNSVISKFRLGNEYITDFAYLTKSSISWNFAMIELESPHKKIFKECNNRYEFTSEFNSGLSQIQTWKQYIKDNENSVLKSISKLKQPLSENNLFFNYVLIYGRRHEIENNEKMRKQISLYEKENNIKIMTYDSLVSNYSYMYGIFNEKIILSQHGDMGYTIKKLQADPITSIFAYLTNEYLKFDKCIEDKLIKAGYQINEWKNGELLTWNDKIADSNHDNYIKEKFSKCSKI